MVWYLQKGLFLFGGLLYSDRRRDERRLQRFLDQQRREAVMKKTLLLIAALGFLLVGCGKGAVESGFWSHPTMYRNFDHMGYSWGGYKNPNEESLKKSNEEDWWGLATSEGKILWGHREGRTEQ
jgi:hypothetical protein